MRTDTGQQDHRELITTLKKPHMKHTDTPEETNKEPAVNTCKNRQPSSQDTTTSESTSSGTTKMKMESHCQRLSLQLQDEYI